MTLVAGWYGKMPSLGDFASRRLPAEFVSMWDAWLQDSIAASRRKLGGRWREVYMTSPMWRFALMPGICGDSAWAGLLVPSVDKVGRHFPLTFALALEPELRYGPITNLLAAAQTWYADLEKLGLAALNVDFQPDDLERGLKRVPFPVLGTASSSNESAVDQLASWWQQPSNVPQYFQLGDADSLPEALTETAERVFAVHAMGTSIWWCESAQSGLAQVHCFNRLPEHEYFAVLLSGSRNVGAAIAH